MRILSNFKDYYDGAGMGYSPVPVYVRETATLCLAQEKWLPDKIKMFEKMLDPARQARGIFSSPEYEFAVLCIAGTAYVGYRSKRFQEGSYYWAFAEKTIHSLTAKPVAPFEVPEELHRLLNCPVFMLRPFWKDIEVTLNPNLRKETDFAKIMPPPIIFQEIEMYLGNQMVVTMDPNDITMSDVDKVTAHGFDAKWSFRKEPVK
jgi:hypothetical protein